MENFIMQSYIEDLNLCDEIIDFFNKSDKKIHGKVSGGNVIKEIKDSIDVSSEYLPEDIKHRYFNTEVVKIIKEYTKKYEYAHTKPFGFAQYGTIQYYKPGMAFHKFHCERTETFHPVCTRHLTFMTYLNDVTDGGETEFFYQNVKIQPRKGLTVIWPVDWTHTHRGLTSNTQDKYIITGWTNYI